MKSFKLLSLAALSLILSLAAAPVKAALLIEPHLAYNVTASGDATLTSTTYEYSYSGPQVGARLGYQMLGLMAGMDYTRSSYDFKSEYSNTSSKESFGRNEIGVFVGYNLPILLRFWGTYYFSNNSKNSAGTVKYSGNTKELGVGFTALPFLSLNLMYRMVTFDKSNGAALASDINLNEIVFGVSLPLTL